MQPKFLLGGADAYALSADVYVRLTQELVQRHRRRVDEARARGDRAIVVSLDGSDPLADIARTVERNVFAADYGGHSPERMVEAYGPYEDRSLFFVALDPQTEEALGVLRGVVSWAGVGPLCKTMYDILAIESYHHEFDDVLDLRDETGPQLSHIGRLGRGGVRSGGLDRRFVEDYHTMKMGDLVFDMATVVVPRENRSAKSVQQIGELLYAASYRAAVRIEAKHAVTFIHEGLLTHFRDSLGMPWENLGGLGSTQYFETDPFVSQPAYLSLDRFAGTIAHEQFRQKLNRPQKFGERHEPFINLLASPSYEPLFSM